MKHRHILRKSCDFYEGHVQLMFQDHTYMSHHGTLVVDSVTPPPNWYKLLVSIKEIPEPYTPKCFPQPEQRSTTQHAHNHYFKPGRITKTLTRFKPRLPDWPNQNEKITQPQTLVFHPKQQSLSPDPPTIPATQALTIRHCKGKTKQKQELKLKRETHHFEVRCWNYQCQRCTECPHNESRSWK